MSEITERRSIKINPDLFKFPTTNSTRKKRENVPKIKVRSTPTEKNTKTLKRNLLKYIRRHQDDIQKESSKHGKYTPDKKEDEKIETAIESQDFKDSLDYLLKLTKETENQEKSTPKNNTLKHRPNIDIHDLINNNIPNHGPMREMVSLEMPPGFDTNPMSQLSPIMIHTNNEPQYGCLKNGNKPTFRTWKNHTQRSHSGTNLGMNPTTITDPTSQRIQQIQKRSNITRVNQFASSPQPPVEVKKPESQKLSDILKREQMKQMKQLNIPKKIKRPKQCQKTMRRTYRVGRSKVAHRISVLVSNRTIRKNISTQSQLLKQTPIKDVKQYLIKKGLIRVGSIAPNEVLRRMYETSKMMCGELQNHNPENLLYNFLNQEGEP
jgi:hypothetical protein